MTARGYGQERQTDTNMILRYTLAWLPMVIIGIVNGVIRAVGYAQYLGELRAHQVSTVTAIVLFGIYVWALMRRWPLASSRQALTVGGIWLALTVVFEFVFGHYVMGHPWSTLLHDYNFLAGRLWALVLIWLALAPYVFYRWSGVSPRRQDGMPLPGSPMTNRLRDQPTKRL